MPRYDVLILGGGIIGCALAEELARRGQSVCVLERGRIGGEASIAAAGILSAQMDVERPGPFFELCQEARRLYPSWVSHLEARSGIPVEFHVDGILYMARTAREAARMEQRVRWQRAKGLNAERWSPRALRQREPAVSEGFRAGYFFPTEAQVDPVKLMRALAAACRRAGVALREQTAVSQLLMKHDRVQGVIAGHRRYRAPIVVNCLGSWATQVGDLLPKHAVVPVRGQILAFDAPQRLFRHVVMSEAAYGVQRRDGTLLVGSTLERAGYDKHVTFDGIRTITEGFHRLVQPQHLAQCRFVDAWAGLRPCSRDTLPVLGPTSVAGLYAAFAHFRHGILLAPATARVLADMLLTDQPVELLIPFSPKRFQPSKKSA